MTGDSCIAHRWTFKLSVQVTGALGTTKYLSVALDGVSELGGARAVNHFEPGGPLEQQLSDDTEFFLL